MPRYFFDLYNDVDTIDEEGVELPDLAAARAQVRQTLPAMIKDLPADRDAVQFRVDVRDTGGNKVLSSTVLMVLQVVGNGGAS